MADIQTKLQEEKALRAIRARRRFKAVVRHVIHNLYWLQDDDDEEVDEKPLTVRKVVPLGRKPRKSAKTFSLKQKALLKKHSDYRTEDEKKYLYKFLGSLKCFRRYPEYVQQQLVAVSYFEYYGPGRALIREKHEAHAMYFLLSGEVLVSRMTFDEVTNQWISVDIGRSGEGNIFGEVSLLYGVERTATVTTATPCELLVLKKDDFDKILKSTLIKRWDEIRDAMRKFVYFDSWDDVAVRECCILSKIKSYEPKQVISGDGAGQSTQIMSYFIIEGECTMVEDLYVKETIRGTTKFYNLYEPPETKNTESFMDAEKCADNDTCKTSEKLGSIDTSTDYSKNVEEKLKSKSLIRVPSSIAEESKSHISITQPKKIPPNVFPRFMQVCTLTEKAMFTSSDLLKHRRVIALTPVKCLLIPSYWLIQHNKGSVWTRVENYLQTRIPTRETVFEMFKNNKKWQAYRRKITDDIIGKRKFMHNTTIHDVPYSIRVVSDYE